MALKPGYYPPPKLPAPKYANDAAKQRAEQLERDFKAKVRAAQAQPIKRIALL